MKNKKKTLPLVGKFLFIMLAVFPCSLSAQEKLLSILEKEAYNNLEILKKEKIPAYYISYRVTDQTTYAVNSSFGEIAQSSSTNGADRKRILHLVIRVGDYQFDNTHDGSFGRRYGSNYMDVLLPYEDDPVAIRMVVWKETEKLYKSSVRVYQEQLAQQATQVANKDTSPDFSREPREKYIGHLPKRVNVFFDTPQFREKLKKYSSHFSDHPHILDGNVEARMSYTIENFVDSEGAAICQSSTDYRLGLTGTVLTSDGMTLPLYKSYYASTPESLPSDKEVLQEVRLLCHMLDQLREAPIAEPYNGPALLSAEASGVFFHEFFGHRVEGTRMKQETDAQTFKNKVGETVLPPDMQVSFNPTLSTFKSLPLSGHYLFDNEGVRGQKVNVVRDGILRSFLMSRTELAGFPHSNGHSRGAPSLFPVSRQSNMLVESTQPEDTQTLKKMFIEELRQQKLSYGYWFKQVSGGFTFTNRFLPNAFNVTPLIVYRVYVDGRPDELVRGVNMIGTPLAIFSKIMACGNDYAVFNGYCGAESGTIPVACVAPSLLVKSIETQKQNAMKQQPYLLPRP